MGYVVDPTVAPPAPSADVTTPDGKLRGVVDPAYAALWLRADFSAMGTRPTWVRFLRNGKPVRSGYDRRSPGGIAKAYDFLAPLGESLSSWTAVPIDALGNVMAGASQPLTMSLPEPTRTQGDVWLKSVNDPSLSLLCLQMEPAETVGAQGRSSLSAANDSSLPTGTWSVGVASGRTVVIKTRTKAEHDKLWRLLGSGVLYVQRPSYMWTDDLYAVPGNINVQPQSRLVDPARLFEIELLPVVEPSHVDAPLIIPGRAWGDFGGTWAQAKAAFTTWGQATKP